MRETPHRRPSHPAVEQYGFLDLARARPALKQNERNPYPPPPLDHPRF